jgi:hypothetical protein
MHFTCAGECGRRRFRRAPGPATPLPARGQGWQWAHLERRELLLEVLDRAAVDLDRRHVRVLGEKVRTQRPLPRPDFHHVLAARHRAFQRSDDPSRDVLVHEEVLPQRLLGLVRVGALVRRADLHCSAARPTVFVSLTGLFGAGG